MQEVTLGFVVVVLLLGAYMVYQHELRIADVEDQLYGLNHPPPSANGPTKEKPARASKPVPPPGAVVVEDEPA